MYLVRSFYDTDKDIAALSIALDQAHKVHVRQYTRGVVVGMISDDEGVVIGTLSINDYDAFSDVEHYVYEDPYAKAGMFKDIQIEKVGLYKLDGSYECCPDWFAEDMKRHQAARKTP
jgi:uncharacterized protein YciI